MGRVRAGAALALAAAVTHARGAAAARQAHPLLLPNPRHAPASAVASEPPMLRRRLRRGARADAPLRSHALDDAIPSSPDDDVALSCCDSDRDLAAAAGGGSVAASSSSLASLASSAAHPAGSSSLHSGGGVAAGVRAGGTCVSKTLDARLKGSATARVDLEVWGRSLDPAHGQGGGGPDRAASACVCVRACRHLVRRRCHHLICALRPLPLSPSRRPSTT